MYSQAMLNYGAPLEHLESATPKPAGGEVLVKIRHCGVCHSDLHMHDGHFDMGAGKQLDVRAGRTLPFALGHEIEGEVEALGPDARGVAVGDRRAVYPWIGCGECALCLAGEEIFCARPRHYGITVNGGYASHVLVPDTRYLLDTEGIDPALASTLMCSGLTAYSALKKLSAQAPHGPVLIVGLGGVGMMAVEFAKAIFAHAPLVADIDAAKREEALRRGAALAFDPASPDAAKALFKASGGGVAGAADFVGSEGSFQFAQGSLRKGGKAVVAGLMGGRFSMALPMLPLRAITIQGSFVGTLEEAREMLALVSQGKVNPIPIRTLPLSQANSALEALRAGKVIGRLVLTPD